MKIRKILRYNERNLDKNRLCQDRMKWRGVAKVVRKPTLVYPVNKQYLPAYDRHHQGYEASKWNSIDMLHLRRFKDTIISYSLQSSYVKQILNSWAIQNTIIPPNWKDLATAILDAVPQLQWCTWWKEEVNERMNNEIGLEVLIFSKISCNVKVSMLSYKSRLNVMITPWHYVI